MSTDFDNLRTILDVLNNGEMYRAKLAQLEDIERTIGQAVDYQQAMAEIPKLKADAQKDRDAAEATAAQTVSQAKAEADTILATARRNAAEMVESANAQLDEARAMFENAKAAQDKADKALAEGSAARELGETLKNEYTNRVQTMRKALGEA